MIEFSFNGYSGLIKALQERNYYFADYHNYSVFSKCVILRHDIDNSIEKAVEIADDEVAKIEALIDERKAAKKEKNFARADEIRAQLLDMGIIIEDTREGTKWKKA